MQSMDDCLMRLYEAQMITGYEAYMKSQNKRRFGQIAEEGAVLPGASG